LLLLALSVLLILFAEHPWRDWFIVLVVAALLFLVVWWLVSALIRWAKKEPPKP